VSVGNVHVMLDRQNTLDLDLLAAIRKSVPAGLVLHGGTGIDPDSLRKACSLGVVKVNFGSYLKLACLNALRQALPSGPQNPHRLLGFGGPEDLLVAARLAVRDASLQRIESLGCCGKAWT
jgi:fructose/tagatose bisphosphate aldolase